MGDLTHATDYAKSVQNRPSVYEGSPSTHVKQARRNQGAPKELKQTLPPERRRIKGCSHGRLTQLESCCMTVGPIEPHMQYKNKHRQPVSFVFRNSKHSSVQTVDAQPDSTRKFRTPPTHKVHVRTHRRGAADGGKGKSRNTHTNGVPDPVVAC